MSARNKEIRAGSYERAIIELDRKAVAEDARTVPAALSSETEVERWFGRELLVHDDEAIDFSRVNGLGLPLLWNHSTDQPIGRIENLRLDGDRVLRGVLRFSKNNKANEIWTDVREGFLNAVSIGYKVMRWEEEQDSDLVRVTRWQPVEASIVSVPADASVGVNRNAEGGRQMSHDNGQQTDPGTGHEAVAIEHYRSSFEAGKKAAERDIRAREAARMMDIEDIFDNPLIPQDDFYRSLKRSAIEHGWSADQARKAVMDALAGDVDRLPERGAVAPVAVPQMARTTDPQRSQRVQAGEDQLDKFAGIVTDALLVRSGIATDNAVKERVDASGYRDKTLLQLAEQHMRARGDDPRGLSNRQIAGAVLTRASGPHTADDFTSILANVANKSTLRGWETAGTTWQLWANSGSLPDFKQATIARLGAFPDIDKIPSAGGPYQHKSMDDIHETATLETYGALFGISRHAIINDDLNEFTRVPMAMGQAAARKVDYLAYYELFQSSYVGRTLTQDSTALFDSTHSNYVASGSGAAPSVATLNTAEAAMMRQKAPLPTAESSSLAYIAVSPEYLLVPPELKATAATLIEAQWDPAGTTASKSVRDAPNPWRARLQVVASPMLTLATGWYLAAGRNANVDTVTVFFLNGQTSPYIEQQDNWTSDGVTYKVRVDAVARALDFRGLYFNYGA